jgi:hypothetical protein
MERKITDQSSILKNRSFLKDNEREGIDSAIRSVLEAVTEVNQAVEACPPVIDLSVNE